VRQIQKWESPLVAVVIFVALVCLSILEHTSFYVGKGATQKKVMLNQMSSDRMGLEAIDDKAHE
jgi:hypothetical protein